MRVVAGVIVLLLGCSSTTSSTSTPPNDAAAADVEIAETSQPCLNPVSVDANAFPSSPTGCPDDEPSEGGSCSPSGLVCHGYGPLSAPITATCSATCMWSLTQAPPFGEDASSD